MVVPLIASALLLDFFGCMMPLALVEDTKAFKVGVFLMAAQEVVFRKAQYLVAFRRRGEVVAVY